MFNISDYFKKFSKIEDESNSKKEAVLSALRKNCNIDSVNFELRKTILYIKGSPIVKNMVYTKKDAIIASIKENMPEMIVTDIR